MDFGNYDEYPEAPDLINAICSGDEIRISIIARGLNINIQNASGRTPLFIASNSWTLSAMDRFLADGADPNIVDNQGNNPLHAVCARYEDRNSDNITAYGIRLYRSAIRTLVDSNIDINHRNNQGQTPLFLAAMGDDFPAVELLLKLNADPTIGDHQGTLPSTVTTDPNIQALIESYDLEVKCAVDE